MNQMCPAKNKLIWLAAVAVLVSFSFLLFVFDGAQHLMLDLQVYIEAGRRMSIGESVYANNYRVLADDGRWFTLYYFYPPFVALAFSPLAYVAPEILSFSWCFFNFLLVLVCAYGLASIWKAGRFGGEIDWATFAIALFFTVCFEPVYWGIREGQINLLVLVLVLIAIQADFHGRSYIVGCVIALAGLIKLSPFFLLLPALFRRDLRVMASCSVTIVGSFILLFIFAPLNSYLDFFSPFGALFAGTLERQYVFNFAIDRTLLRALGLDDLVYLRWIVRAISFCVVLAASWRMHRTGDRLRTYALVLCGMVALSPVIWFHHLIWLLPAIVIAYPTQEIQEQARYKKLTALLGCYFLIGQTNFLFLQVWKSYPAWSALPALVPVAAILWLGRLILRSKS